MSSAPVMSFFPPVPLIKSDNPLYCPEVSVQQYMSSIRLFQASVADTSKFPFFHRLCTAFLDNNFNDSPGSLPLQLMRKQLPSGNAALGTINTITIKKEEDNSDIDLAFAKKNVKRGSDELSSSSMELLRGIPKKAKRSSSQINMSFVLSAKADQLLFSDKIALLSDSDVKIEQDDDSPRAGEVFWPELDDASHDLGNTGNEFVSDGAKRIEGDIFRLFAFLRKGFWKSDALGPETPKSISSLFRRLEELLPGIRLTGQLDPSVATNQDVVNLLGIKGHLNPQTLSLFRNSQIRSLNFTESMVDMDGLNLLRNDVLKVLKDPSTFLSLRSIVLSDVPLSDDDLAHLTNLTGLDSLFLDDTRIGDVAIMHIFALKQSLTHLELSWNERISDDAIPTLCNFSNLVFLSLKGTAVTMKGIRKLASSVKERTKKISIILPSECEKYVCNQHNEYVTKLAESLIHDPATCLTLSEPELRKNLAGHAKFNPEVSTDGTRAELEKRLYKLLERRQKDVIVHGFMLQGFA